ncbi:MAG: acyltransferase [Syntrophomonadaceae bacterium]
MDLDERMPARKNREQFWQAIRGICIISVVLIHCRLGADFKDAGVWSFNYHYWLILRQFVDFPVAFFMFLAGYFINIKGASAQPWQFISGRAQRIVIPYLVWSVFYLVLQINLGNIMSFKTIAYKLATGDAYIQLYFVIALLQLVIITPLLIKCMRHSFLNLVCLCITPVYLIWLYLYCFVYHQQFPLYLTLFPAWLIFYYLGMKFRRYKLETRSDLPGNDLLNAGLLAAAALLSSCIECYYLLAKGHCTFFAVSQVKISSFLYAAAVIHYFFVIRRYSPGAPPLLVKLGDYSFGIFFIHPFFLVVIDKVLSWFPIFCACLIGVHLIQLVGALFLSYYAVVIARSILGEKPARQWLGF